MYGEIGSQAQGCIVASEVLTSEEGESEQCRYRWVACSTHSINFLAFKPPLRCEATEEDRRGNAIGHYHARGRKIDITIMH